MSVYLACGLVIAVGIYFIAALLCQIIAQVRKESQRRIAVPAEEKNSFAPRSPSEHSPENGD